MDFDCVNVMSLCQALSVEAGGGFISNLDSSVQDQIHAIFSASEITVFADVAPYLTKETAFEANKEIVKWLYANGTKFIKRHCVVNEIKMRCEVFDAWKNCVRDTVIADSKTVPQQAVGLSISKALSVNVSKRSRSESDSDS